MFGKKLTLEELTEDDITIQFDPNKVPAVTNREVRAYAHKWHEDYASGIVTAELSGYRWREIQQTLKSLPA